MISEFDKVIIEALNALSQSSYLLARIMSFVTNNDLFKWIIVVTILWYVWLKDLKNVPDDSIFILRAFSGAVSAILLGRVAQNFLPMRLRPIHNPDINFVVPCEALENVLGNQSSFPSDHAILFFALSTAIWARNSPLELFAFAWSFFIISFPRIYLGFHYPSDILAGAFLGIALMIIFLKIRLPAAACTFLNWLQHRHIGWLYAGIFFFSVEIATLFDSLRTLAKGIKMFFELIGLSA